MRARNVSVLFGVVSGVLAASCSSSRTSGFENTPPPAQSAPPSNNPGLGDGTKKADVPISVTGTVYAPNGTLPMANTLVYVTAKEPDAIPQEAYCDQCVTLDEGTFAVSAADGKFEIKTTVPNGDAWLVVQKGQFRRVRKITIEKAGAIDIKEQDVTLPGRSDPSAGDNVPKMVVLKDATDFDKIDQSLKKLGIDEFDVRNDRALLDDETALLKYQIVFIPCGNSDDERSASPKSKANMQKFVESGGKLYVTDWSYEFVRQPFTGYVSWEREGPSLGSATDFEWDAPATAADKGLGDWLAATGNKTFDVKGNWTTIKSVNTMSGKDPKGQAIDIQPKVWVTAQKYGKPRPTTVSFEDQCGRVLFSSYHTEPEFVGSSTLYAQEKALLYVLLEVGVCVGGVDGVK